MKFIQHYLVNNNRKYDTNMQYIVKHYRNNMGNLRLSLKSSIRMISLTRCSGLRLSTLRNTHTTHTHTASED